MVEDKIRHGKEVITEKLNIPREISLDVPKIIVIGNREITIENHKGIITFDVNEIKINSRVGAIKIQGSKFEILYIGGDTISISGNFKAIIYEGFIE